MASLLGKAKYRGKIQLNSFLGEFQTIEGLLLGGRLQYSWLHSSRRFKIQLALLLVEIQNTVDFTPREI
jgi:hypothetical protein